MEDQETGEWLRMRLPDSPLRQGFVPQRAPNALLRMSGADVDEMLAGVRRRTMLLQKTLPLDMGMKANDPATVLSAPFTMDMLALPQRRVPTPTHDF